MIYWDTISPSMRRVMNVFGGSQIGASFYLAGGTALALQLGHRRSVDLDFFSSSEDIPTIRQPLLQALQSLAPLLADSSWGNLVFLASGVQVGFYGYGYPMVAPFTEVEGARLASVADIGLMKLDALLARASRKDFYDLYAICQAHSLRQLLDDAPLKYPDIRDFEAQVVKRLAYFERADQEEQPVLIREIPWEAVKEFFRQQALDFGRSWLT
jgi:hypothetical protein